MRTHDIRPKTGLVLRILFFCFALIMLRVWQLAVPQHEERVKDAERPAKRVVITHPPRGTIRDRFNSPLAVNQLSYQAAIRYSDFALMSSKKRREYVRSLAGQLSELLALDEERLVDLIYSKAVFYGSVPYVVKDHLSEEEYYRVRALEREYPGVVAIRTGSRSYPKGRVGASVVGYMGAMSQGGLDRVLEERRELEELLALYEEGEAPNWPEGIESYDEALMRLDELSDRCYSGRDLVGKSGIEAQFEEALRGFYGKEVYRADARGTLLKRRAGGRPPAPGHRLLLTISEELQQYAEELLIRHEGYRRAADLEKGREEGPWIRGGAIVAMDPKSGELLALASTPRFDPGDFAEKDPEKRARVLRWLEGEAYVAAVWDQQLPLEREEWKEGRVVDVGEKLTLKRYLSLILPKEHPITRFLEKRGTLKQAVELQRSLDEARERYGIDDLSKLIAALYPEGSAGVKLTQVDRYEWNRKISLDELGTNQERLFAIDLMRLFAPHDYFSDELLAEVGSLTLETFREESAGAVTLLAFLKETLKEEYHTLSFKTWKERNSKEYLKAKRKEERAERHSARPYLDYLDAVERDLYTLFWQMYRHDILHTFLTGKKSNDPELKPYEEIVLQLKQELESGAHGGSSWHAAYLSLKKRLKEIDEDQQISYLQAMRSFNDLSRPLVQRYSWIKSDRPVERDLAAQFYAKWGYGNMRSNAFSARATHGSIFKLITAYAALIQRYEKGIRPLNPFEIIDQVRKVDGSWKIGYWLDGKPIPRIYKGGRLPKSLSKNIGRTDLVKAIERSSNPYFALLAADHLDDPEDLAKAAALFSYGSKTGIELPGEISGLLPRSLSDDPGDLYASAIGQGTLVVTPLQTAVMLSTLANGGEVLRPKIIHLEVAPKEEAGEEWLEEILSHFSIEAPLFRERLTKSALVRNKEKEVVRRIPLPDEVASLIKQGMRRVVEVTPASRFGVTYGDWKEMITAYTEMKPYIIGKSSSAEMMERVNLDPKEGVKKITHSWFGGIIYEDEERTKPELVVVVYLPFAERGNDALPPVALIGKKWREIKNSRQLLDK